MASDLFCAAPSSTLNFPASSSSHGGRAIDRCSPHLRDPLREKYISSKAKPSHQKNTRNKEKTPQVISPATSSRYLLHDISPEISTVDDFSDTEIIISPEISAVEDLSDNEIMILPEISTSKLKLEYTKCEDFVLTRSPSPVSQRDQVVVLKVSLHCKGCEGKVRKHLSKMKDGGWHMSSKFLRLREYSANIPLTTVNSSVKPACYNAGYCSSSPSIRNDGSPSSAISDAVRHPLVTCDASACSLLYSALIGTKSTFNGHRRSKP